MKTIPSLLSSLQCCIATALFFIGLRCDAQTPYGQLRTAPPPLKLTVEVLPTPNNTPRLNVVLTNESLEIIRLDGNCLPKREGGCGLNLVAIAEHKGSQPLAQSVVPSNASGEIKLAPKGRIVAELVLDDRFPTLQKMLERKPVLLFWWYQPTVAIGKGSFFEQKYQGGLVVLPKTAN